MEYRILFGDYSPIIFSRVIDLCALCVMHRPSTFENKYSNIFFYKTIAPTILKMYMKHDLPPGSQNYKIGPGRISKMAAITKNSQNSKINFLQNHWIFLAEFWHGISMEHRYSEL